MLKNWGYNRLAAKVHLESIDEMKHADELIERILYLGGIPNMQRLWKVNVGETVPEQFACDKALEDAAIPFKCRYRRVSRGWRSWHGSDARDHPCLRGRAFGLAGGATGVGRYLRAGKLFNSTDLRLIRRNIGWHSFLLRARLLP